MKALCLLIPNNKRSKKGPTYYQVGPILGQNKPLIYGELGQSPGVTSVHETCGLAEGKLS